MTSPSEMTVPHVVIGITIVPETTRMPRTTNMTAPAAFSVAEEMSSDDTPLRQKATAAEGSRTVRTKAKNSTAAGRFAAKTTADHFGKDGFSAGDWVRWDWQGSSVQGKVTGSDDDSITVEGNTITGGDDETVYELQQYEDGDLTSWVAKPESSLRSAEKPAEEKSAIATQAARVVGSILKATNEDSWTSYEGPRGEQGWRNDHTGEIRYQENRPTDTSGEASDEDGSSGCGGGDDEPPDSGESERTESHDPDPDRDIPRFRESEKAANQIAETNETEEIGFTFHRDLQLQELETEDVWLVSISETEQDNEISKVDVTNMYERHLSVLQDTSGLRIGGWHFEEGRRWSVDLNAAVKDKEEAERLGTELNQESIFNIGTMEEVKNWRRGWPTTRPIRGS